tara:strand:- start:9 stop:200 length:192 start_codon:yes stop_codon:yes gene_type:complete
MREVTSKDGLGVGIVGLGVMYLVYPWASATMAGAEAFGMLSGMSGVSGLLTILAGVAVLRSKD